VRRRSFTDLAAQRPGSGLIAASPKKKRPIRPTVKEGRIGV